METRKEHWERIYSTKQPHEVGWTQEYPTTSISFIQSFELSKQARIIDIGGGDSKLVDCLLEEGFENITVLDISERALQRAQQRLGMKAGKVKWIESDIAEFHSTEAYDLWHDRAVFHFLNHPKEINAYIAKVEEAASRYLIIGTFSDCGPQKCSGLDVHRYDEDGLKHTFEQMFDNRKCIREDHITPFQTKQNFLFCSFERRNPSSLVAST